MRCVLVPLCLLALAVGGGVRAQDKAKDKPAPKPKAPAVVPIVGTVQRFQESTNQLTLRLTLRWIAPNPTRQAEHLRRQQELMRRQAQVQAVRDPRQRWQQMQQLQRDVAQLQRSAGDLFKVEEKHQDLEMVLAEDAKVHTAVPGEEFDDRGNVRVPTPEELKKRRGDTRLPGFPAMRDVIESGRTVLVHVKRRAGGDPEASEKKGKAPELEATFVLVGPAPPMRP